MCIYIYIYIYIYILPASACLHLWQVDCLMGMSSEKYKSSLRKSDWGHSGSSLGISYLRESTGARPRAERRDARLASGLPSSFSTRLLYYTILYYTTLYYTILYYTILYYLDFVWLRLEATCDVEAAEIPKDEWKLR